MLPVSSVGTTYIKLSPAQNAYLNQLTSSGRSRELPVTIAIGMVISSLIPNAQDCEPLNTFGSQAALPALDFLNAINTITPVDFRQAMELARNFYVQRHEAYSCPFHAFTPSAKEGICSLFGLTKHIPANVLEVMNCDSITITRHFMEMRDIACALAKTE